MIVYVYCDFVLIMWSLEIMWMFDELGIDEGSLEVRIESLYVLSDRKYYLYLRRIIVCILLYGL